MTPVDNQTTRRALGSRYELVDVIGSGAMGEVWRAWDRTDQTYRAAKVLRSEFTADPEILTRFIQERSIMLALRHPHIVQVHDLVVEGDSLAIVMELVEGPGLRGHLRAEGTLSPLVAVQVAAAVLDALAAAHAAGTLHRDVKPDNILLAGGRDSIGDAVRLTDFGIARLAQESTVQATGLLGTPSYMPPELFERGITSAASDVYAVGIMLYEMLAGRTPFAGSGTAHTIGFRHLTALPPKLDVPYPLWSALNTMLSKDPRVRLSAAATAEQLRELSTALAGLPAGPRLAEPADWDRVVEDSQTVNKAIRAQSLPASDDVGGTRIRGAGSAAVEVGAVEGSVQALVPGEADGDGFTQVRHEPKRRAEAPTLASSVTVKEKSRKPLLLTIAAAVVVVAVVGGLAIGGVFSGGGSKSARTQNSGPASAATLPTSNTSWAGGGLTYSSQASFEAGRGVTLTLAFNYPYDITGSLMVVIPALTSGRSCPQVTWDSGSIQTSSLSSSSQDPVACGFALNPTGAPAGSLEVSATIPATSVTTQQLTTWLQAIDQRTSSAVQEFGGDPATYALQEIEGISVSPSNAGFKILARWLTGESSSNDTLFDSTRDTTVDNALAALLGLPMQSTPWRRVAGDVVTVQSNCGGALTQDGAFHAGSCGGSVRVSIGRLSDTANY